MTQDEVQKEESFEMTQDEVQLIDRDGQWDKRHVARARARARVHATRHDTSTCRWSTWHGTACTWVGLGLEF